MSVNDHATLEQRFWSKVDKDDPNGCWLWMGGTNPAGYGGVCQNHEQRLVHRVAYEWCVGPIPDGYVIDHLCEVKNCVNPAHLEAVSQQVNTARAYGPLCKYGHPLDGYQRSDGGIRRYCLTCNRERCRRKRLARKAARS